ncbi:MAG: DUF2071 domain-containing protein [Anaerolineae bacterium]|nr:DUF2071 domain-containing protein [Anaerolineae bacterium]
MLEPLKIDDYLQPRPKPSGIDVVSKLQHFAIITYAVHPRRFEGLLPARFKLDTISVNGEEKGLISVVPFMDMDFRLAICPFPRFTMGQTNYRIYMLDTTTGERCVWFLGTTLDSWTVVVPRHWWQLPWHAGKVRFDCEYVPQTERYRRYIMHTEAEWAPAHVELTQDGDEAFCLEGFPDTETALVYLTHPLTGFYYRRDGQLGTYRVWHEPLAVRPATLTSARFGLLERMQLVSAEQQLAPHSVLLQPINEFTIYLPPRVLSP